MTSTTLFGVSGRAVAIACVVMLACGGKAPESTPTTARSDAPPRDDAVSDAAQATVGQAAPTFEVRDEANNVVRLADHRGKQPVLLAFYPKDFTSG